MQVSNLFTRNVCFISEDIIYDNISSQVNFVHYSLAALAGSMTTNVMGKEYKFEGLDKLITGVNLPAVTSVDMRIIGTVSNSTEGNFITVDFNRVSNDHIIVIMYPYNNQTLKGYINEFVTTKLKFARVYFVNLSYADNAVTEVDLSVITKQVDFTKQADNQVAKA
jgi:hypothetical protein